MERGLLSPHRHARGHVPAPRGKPPGLDNHDLASGRFGHNHRDADYARNDIPVGAAGADPSTHGLCRQYLAGYKVPKDIVFVGEVARSPAGKADYRWARATVEGSLS